MVRQTTLMTLISAFLLTSNSSYAQVVETVSRSASQEVECKLFKEYRDEASKLQWKPFQRVRATVNGQRVSKIFEEDKFEVSLTALSSSVNQTRSFVIATISKDGYTSRSQFELESGFYHHSVELDSPGDVTYYLNCRLD